MEASDWELRQYPKVGLKREGLRMNCESRELGRREVPGRLRKRMQKRTEMSAKGKVALRRNRSQSVC